MRRWLLLALALAALLAIGVAVAAVSTYRLSTGARERLAAYLSERLQSDVSLAECHVTLLPRPRVSGERLVVRHKGRTDVPPLLSVERFSADAPLWGLVGKNRRAHSLRMEGLRIFVPPRGGDGTRATTTDHPEPAKAPREQSREMPDLLVDEVHAENAVLEIGTRKPGKLPRRFDIHRLRLRGVSIARAMSFEAELDNPTPPGRIRTSGTFGPWQVAEPSATPLQGDFTFDKADLGVFKGIDGTLSSRGKYAGVLDRIGVEGEATIPDFEVTSAGNRVPLDARYTAVVDGTNGDTELTRVDARWLGVSLTAKGAVTGTPGVKGRTVSLNVTMRDAALEDLLRLAVKGTKPLMRGRLDMQTRFGLPPGEREVIRRMALDGDFAIARAHFTTVNLEKALAELSRRGRGDVSGPAGTSVASNMRGRFTLKDGVLDFSRLTFGVPGADVQLAGRYTIPNEQMAFSGTLALRAKVSQTTTGWKSVLLKAVDPLFSRGGKGAVVPITVKGSKDQPKFGVDVKRIFTR
jgi:AsmA-like C-terminal region